MGQRTIRRGTTPTQAIDMRRMLLPTMWRLACGTLAQSLVLCTLYFPAQAAQPYEPTHPDPLMEEWRRHVAKAD